MKKLLLIIAAISTIGTYGQKNFKTPGIMLGLDSAVIVREYAHFNNMSVYERWEKVSEPGRIIYYCYNSNDKNKQNVAHIYDFDENGKSFKYTTISTQEKIKYAVDHFNNLTVNSKNLYKFMGVVSDNQAVWVSDDKVAEKAGCDCGNVKVTVISNLKENDNLVQNSGVKPGKSGELLAIVYTPNQ